MKPIKRGYILWCIADNSAYVYGFEVYTGKRKEKEYQPNVDRRLGGKVVVSFTSNLHGRNHKVFFDNYFASISLLEDCKAIKS